MKSLLINTAISVSSVVLIDEDQVVSIVEEENANDLSSKIFYMIDQLFSDNDYEIKDINRVFVVSGPGSFTGIRIGMTIAKTMAWALKIDLIPISSLELLACIFGENKNLSLIDARHQCVYAGGYDSNLNVFFEDQYISSDELLKKFDNDSDIQFVSYDEIALFQVQKPNIDYLKIVKKHESDEVMNCHFVNPVYLKLTEAEEKKQNEI